MRLHPRAEVLVLRAGTVVESGPTLSVIRSSTDPYTRLLLDSLPNPHAGAGDRSAS